MIPLILPLLCSADPAIDRHVAGLSPTITSSTLRYQAQELLRRKPHLIRDRLRFLLRHDDHLKRIAENSYFHFNGFFKIRVLRTDDFGVRLHVWPPGSGRVGDTNPHGHRWIFASWIAAGEGLEETSFVEISPRSAGPDDLEYTRYEYGRGPGGSWLLPTRSAHLRPIRVQRHLIDQVYDCPVNRVHSVAPVSEGLVATIVLQGPARRGAAAVYSYGGQPVEQPEEPITLRALKDVLEQVEANLDLAAAAGEIDESMIPAVAAELDAPAVAGEVDLPVTSTTVRAASTPSGHAEKASSRRCGGRSLPSPHATADGDRPAEEKGVGSSAADLLRESRATRRRDAPEWLRSLIALLKCQEKVKRGASIGWDGLSLTFECARDRALRRRSRSSTPTDPGTTTMIQLEHLPVGLAGSSSPGDQLPASLFYPSQDQRFDTDRTLQDHDHTEPVATLLG